MAIRVPSAGSVVYTTFPVDTTELILSGINASLVSAGWTSTTVFGTLKLTFTGGGNDGETCTIAGIGYRSSTTPGSNPNWFAKGSSASTAASNFAACINAGAGAGTAYGTGTTANTFCTASASGGVVTLTSSVAGSGFSASESLGNASLDSTVSYNGGYRMQCATTPDGRALICALEYNGTGGIRVRLESIDGLLKSNNDTVETSNPGQTCIRAVAARTLSIAACAHQFLVWLPSDVTSGNSMLLVSCPYLPVNLQPVTITGATNATPIQIEVIGHGLTSGTNVYISDTAGNTATNGAWPITFVDADHFTLNGSVGNGAWTSGTGLLVVQTVGISRIMLMDGGCFRNGDAGSGLPCIRSAGVDLTKGNQGSGAQIVNNNNLSSSMPMFSVIALDGGPGGSVGGNGGVSPIWGDVWTVSEARIGWPVVSTVSQLYELAELWLAFYTNDATPLIDSTKTSLFGRNWSLYAKGSKVALWIATS